MLTLVVLVVLLSLISFWLWQQKHFSFWEKRNIANIESSPFVGNVKNLLLYNCCFGEQFQQLYDHSDVKDEPFVGIHVLHNRAILMRDPELIKRVLVKDFSSFASRFETTDPFEDPMGSMNLFFAKYEIWKDIHKIFSPLFAANKVKQMYPLLQQIGEDLEDHMERLNFDSNNQSTETEVKEMCALFTTDLIASLAFGVNAHSLENSKSDFRDMCIEVNDPRPKRILHLFVMFFFPQLAKYVGTHLYSKTYEEFMRHSINHVIAEREKSGLKRNDLIDIFIKLKQQNFNQESVVNKPDFFVAQAAFLLLAGFDTSSSTITFTLYELAKNPEIQKRLREELREALKDGEGHLTYEAINNMEYFKMVVDEILRLYPPTAFLDRCCVAPEGYSLQPYSSFRMPFNMPVYISVLGLHRDKKYWPDPLKFDPERFSPESRKLYTSMTYLPFGTGPRGCIGYILGLLQVKTGLVHILKNYSVSPCSRTLKEIIFDPKTFVLAANGGTYLRFTKDKLYI